ncbi:hypothetical protein [Actinoplanes rectilineatus]|uniref:hypothetical protein n=1 Tax=Actinoplanes rectilineatus TaxID=113571 RepID=UPI0005F2D8F7|nr:hypothetical protein [Actinoplanes rectilineatus]
MADNGDPPQDGDGGQQVTGGVRRWEGALRRLEGWPGLTALVALASFAALVVGVLAAVPDWREMLAGAPAATNVPVPTTAAPTSAAATVSAGSDVNAIDLVARDPERTDPNDKFSAYEPPPVEFTVHNRGTRRSVITRVGVTVEDSMVLRQCASQGEPLAVSASYDVVLPLEPADGTELEVPVGQQQGPDEADRFALRFGTPARESPTVIHIYRLRFALLTDGSEKRLAAGTGIVAVPFAPLDGDGYFWSDIYQGIDMTMAGVNEDIACMKENSAAIERLLDGDVALSPLLSAVKANLRT